MKAEQLLAKHAVFAAKRKVEEHYLTDVEKKMIRYGTHYFWNFLEFVISE